MRYKKITVCMVLMASIGIAAYDIKRLILPGGQALMALDINAKEPLLCVSFKDLIKKGRPYGLSYILACVRTSGSGKCSCLDAIHLHTLLHQQAIDKGYYLDPASGEKIENIHYFIIDSLDNNCFEYVGLYNDGEWGAGNDYLQKFLTAHEILVPGISILEDRWAARFNLAYAFYGGTEVAVNYAKAFGWWRFVADQDENKYLKARAQLNLAVMYCKGQGVEKDYARAYELWSIVAGQNENESAKALAQFNLGSMYYNGAGVKRDVLRAYELWRLVAGQNDDKFVKATARFNLGLMRYGGDGVPIDYSFSALFFGLSAEQDDNEDIKEKSINFLMEIAFQDNNRAAKVAAQNCLADYVSRNKEEIGQRYSLNLKKLLGFISIMAAQNYDKMLKADAQFKLAWMYRKGKGVQQNYSVAHHLLEEVMQQQDNKEMAADAKWHLAVMYRNGEGVPPDYEKSSRLLGELEHQNDSPFARLAGKYLLWGESKK